MKRIISFLLSVCLLLPLVPMGAHAAEDNPYGLGVSYTVGDASLSTTDLTFLGDVWDYFPGVYDAQPVYSVKLPENAKVTGLVVNADHTLGTFTPIYRKGEDTVYNFANLTSTDDNLVNAEFTGSGLTDSDDYQLMIVDALSDKTVLDRLETSGVTGFAVVAPISDVSKYAAIIVQLPYVQTSTADTTALAAKVAEVTGSNAANWYQENDRYNGNSTSAKGFWADLQPTLQKAQNYLENPPEKQQVVDDTTKEIEAAISKLIPTSQVNATELYELINTHYWWWGGKFVPVDNIDLAITAKDISTKTWNAYQTALDNARAELNRLFDENGQATAYNSTAEGSDAPANVAAAVSAIQTAVDGLDRRASASYVEDANMAYEGLSKLVKGRFAPDKLDQADYTAESWAAYQTAYENAETFLSEHKAPDEAMGLGQRETDAYSAAYNEFWSACYNDLTSSKETIHASITVTDNHALRRGKELSDYVGTYAVTASAENTLSDVLDDLLGSGYSLFRSDIDFDLGVYVNGVYVFNTGAGNSVMHAGVTSAGYENIRLKDGDSVVIALMQSPIETNLSGSVSKMLAPDLLSAVSHMTLTDDKGGVDVVEMTAGTCRFTARQNFALPSVYTGSTTALSGADVYLSDPCATEADVRKAATKNATGVTTGTDGSFQLDLSVFPGQTDGWYAVNLVVSGEKGGLTNGETLLVHVTDPSDISDLRKDYLTRLEEIYTAYSDDFYSEAQLAEVKQLYEDAVSVIQEATDTGTCKKAFSDAYQAIQAIQDENNTALTRNLKNVRLALDYLPRAADVAAGHVYSDDKELLDYLFGTDGRVDRMTEYQKSQFTAAEKALLESLRKAYEDSENGTKLEKAPMIKLNVEVYDADTKEPVNDALQNFAQTYTIYHGIQEDEDGVFIGFDGGQTEADYAQDDGTTPANASVTAVRFNLMDYTPVSAEHNVASECVNDFNIRAKEVSYARFAKLNSDATITIYVTRNKTEAETLESAKADAKAALEAAYADYTEAAYSADNWAALTKAKDDGIAAIESAEDVSAVETARKDAIAGMAKIKTLKQENDSSSSSGGASGVKLPDYGSVVGQVHIIVENQTFTSAASDGSIPAWYGKLIDGWYDLCERDTMMTSILKALQLKGCHWSTGSQGVADKWDDYDISYLASIQVRSDVKADGEFHINDASQRLGEFSGEAGSGWMGTLNDWFTNYGFDQFGYANGQLHSGDEIHVVFTQDLGVDVGGGWGISDTSLASLEVTGGQLTPNFNGTTTTYALAKGSGAVTVTPSAVNKNYQVRTYINEKSGDNWYRRGTTLPVKVGDTIYIGVGEKDWPSMNNNKGYEISYEPTWYTIRVVDSSSADSVIEMIKNIPTITYSNYKDLEGQVTLARKTYNSLSSDAKAKVTNLDKLKAAEEAVKKFQEIDRVKSLLAALPNSDKATDTQVKNAKRDIETAGNAYMELSDEQKGYITVGDYKNYNALVERLSKLTQTSAGVISKNPDEEAASDVISLISTIGTVTKDSGDKIKAARDAYDKLSEAQKKLVSNYDVLTEAEAALAKLNNGGLAFTDVKESDYFYDAVKWAVEKSITSGTSATTFSPNAACTRAQMVAFLWRAAGSPEPTSKTNPFTDVKEDAYYYKALLWAIENGITKGTTETTFSPDAACTRGQMAAFLYRNAKSPAVTGSSAFTDVSSSDYYSDAVTWAAQTGVTKGTTATTFSPNAACTRAQMVSFLYRYLAK